MGVRFDNLTNTMVQGTKVVPVKRQWGHPFWMPFRKESNLAWCHLTEAELRQVHRRFGHPSVNRLAKILERAGHDIERKVVEHLTMVCHHCQMHGKSPGRFRFSLKDDRDFNYQIWADVLWIDGTPVLQVVDEATSYQNAIFLEKGKDKQTAKALWDAFRRIWIDTYLGPPDWIAHDAGKNFGSREFRQYAHSMHIDVSEAPVESHNTMGKVEISHPFASSIRDY
jgi:hypothetical protein